ncbi:TPA: hypothetical protein N2817_002547 [Vibrio parahaemolyticus]|nr:hypothetical protein [Vibrio parahaemolyticus]
MKRFAVFAVVPMVLMGCFNESELKEIHSGFTVDIIGTVSLCGVEQRDFVDGISALELMKKTYRIDELDKEVKTYQEETIFANFKPAPDYPIDLDGYFRWKDGPYDTNKDIVDAISSYEFLSPYDDKGSMRKYLNEYRKRLAYRKASGIPLSEAVRLREEWKKAADKVYKDNMEMNKSMLHEFELKQQPKYAIAACLFNTDQYIELGESILNDKKYYAKTSKLASDNMPKVKDKILDAIRQKMADLNVDYDEIKQSKYSDSVFEISNDEDVVGKAYTYYSMYQDVFKMSVVYAINDIDKPAFTTYFYN